MKMRTCRAVRGVVIVVAAACGCLATVDRSLGQAPGQRPFENTYRRPNVSPYLQLQEQGFNPLQTQNIYQTQVLPKMEQQRQQIEQLQQRRQLGQMQNQVQRIQQGTQARQIDETIRPTGHASTYMNYSHFYPMRR